MSAFPLFSRLPIELRFQVWELVDFPPVLTVRISNSTQDWKVRNATPLPGVLLACRESRMLTLSTFRPYFAYIGRPYWFCDDTGYDRTLVCFNPKETILEISIDDNMTYERCWPLEVTRDRLADIIGPVVRQAEHLHIQCDDLPILWDFWGRRQPIAFDLNLGWNKGFKNGLPYYIFQHNTLFDAGPLQTVTESSKSFDEINASELKWCDADFKLEDRDAKTALYFTARRIDSVQHSGWTGHLTQPIIKDSGLVTLPLKNMKSNVEGEDEVRGKKPDGTQL